MCFSQEMSAAFSALGLVFAIFVMMSNGNGNILKGVLYFVAMELLQTVQYSYIATDVDANDPTYAQMKGSPQCNTQMNRFLTFLGILHICYQPFFSAHLSCAFVRSEANVAQFNLVKKMQLFGGTVLLCRHLGTYIDASTFTALGLNPGYAFDPTTWSAGVEWLDGPALCTYAGVKHLAWSIPFMPVSYYVPSMGIHSFLMFAPFFVMNQGSFMANVPNYIAGFVLFLSGPVLGDWITPNKHESASIWCFFSMLQVCGLVCIIVVQRHSKGRWFSSKKDIKTN